MSAQRLPEIYMELNNYLPTHKRYILSYHTDMITRGNDISLLARDMEDSVRFDIATQSSRGYRLSCYRMTPGTWVDASTTHHVFTIYFNGPEDLDMMLSGMKGSPDIEGLLVFDGMEDSDG